MGELLSLVAEPILEVVIKVTASLINDTYSSERGVKKDVEKLSSNLSAIKAVLEDAENKQIDNPQLKDWLVKLREAAFDAEDILLTFETEAYHWKRQVVKKYLPLPGKALFKYGTARKIKDISQRFDTIAKQKENFRLDNLVNGGGPESRRDTGFFVDESSIVGRENDRKSLIHMLLSEEFDREDAVSVIPIIGMGGVGKTTLAQLVFNEESVRAHFESRMWVCVTLKFELTRILKEMIQFHSKMRLDGSSKSHLQHRLLEFLRGQRFLLVLDDVWTKDLSSLLDEDLSSLLDLLKQGAKGSRVLVTSRITRIKEIKGSQAPHLLDDLPEDECWSLFSMTAFNNIGNLPRRTREELEEIGREIVRKCRGLPLAVKAMGGLLRGHADDVSKWRQIQGSRIWEIEGDDVMPSLRLSYDHLPADLKRCFQYCSIFPKAYEFRKEELVKLWIAEGFIKSSAQITMEEAGIGYFRDLLTKSFFQSSTIDDKEIFIMHDLIHDLAESISSPTCCQVKENELCGFAEESPLVSLRHVSLVGENVEQPMLKIAKKARKLRSLLLPSCHFKKVGQALDELFHKLKFIRVLDLSSCMIPELPDSVEKLKLLHYLDLSRTGIKVLPNSICNLFRLQTLKLLGCLWLSELPKDLGNLVNLRHLELDGIFWFKSSILPSRLGKLVSLHNLPVFPVGHDDGYGIEQLERMANLSGTLHISKLENVTKARDAKLSEKKSLDKLVFEWSDDRVVNEQDEAAERSVLEDLQPHSYLKKLQILRYQGNGFPAWMEGGQLRNLVCLTLNGCKKCQILNLGRMPHLGELYVKDMRELKIWTEVECDDWMEVECHSLYHLTLSNCPNLRALPSIFPNLSILKIKSCDSLMALPKVPSVRYLTLTDNLALEDWNEELVRIRIPPMEGDNQDQYETREIPSLVQVFELKVKGCPKLQALPRFFFPEKLEISGCDLLRTLPPALQACCLQHLALDACHDVLMTAIPDTTSLCSLVISNISNLSSLPTWPQLPNLKVLYIHDCKDLVSLSNGEDGSLRTLTSLELLSIKDCEMLETLSEALPTSLQCLTIASCYRLESLGSLLNLSSLKDLYIEDCRRLQALPNDGLPNSLQHLLIQRCPLLAERCQMEGGGGPDWPKIENIPDLEI